MEEVESKLDSLFDIRPSIGVQVIPVPKFKESTAPPAYYFPAPVDRVGLCISISYYFKEQKRKFLC